MHGTVNARVPRSSTPGTFNPEEREAPSGGTPGTPKCPALHHTQPPFSIAASICWSSGETFWRHTTAFDET